MNTESVHRLTIGDFLMNHTKGWSKGRRLSFALSVPDYAECMGIICDTVATTRFGAGILYPIALLLHVAEEQKTLIASVGNIRTAEEELKRRTGSN